MIGEWNFIFSTNRHKNDFKHVNDMYRLLEYKGYRFPKLKESVKNEYEPAIVNFILIRI
jgi:ADP-ribosylation factor-binding protein GGA